MNYDPVYAASGTVVALAAIFRRALKQVLSRFLIGSAQSTSAEIYAENNKALIERDELQQREIADLQRRLATAQALGVAQQKQIDAQQRQIDDLTKLVLQVEGLQEARNEMAANHEALLTQMNRNHLELAGLIKGKGNT